MILLSMTTPGGPRLAAKLSSGILPLGEACARLSGSEKAFPETLEQALTEPDGLNRVQRLVSTATRRLKDVRDLILQETAIQVGFPFRPNNIICVGENYRGHVEENNGRIPAQPVLFAKLRSSLTGPGAPIVIPSHSQQTDYEAELAVVIGKTCKSTSPEKAIDFIAGYTCLNDISARDFQSIDGQWVRAKSQDTFAPFGPYLVTKDEVPDPQALPIRSWVNGELRQNSNTKDMIFPIRELIAYISRGITLSPGDVITTGTPGGVGAAMKPPVFLKAGDRLSIEVGGVGRLSNPVIGQQP